MLGKHLSRATPIIFRLKTPTAACSSGDCAMVPWPELVHRRRCAGLQGHGGPVILDLLLKRILTIPACGLLALVSFPNARFLTITRLSPGRGDCRSYRRQFGTGARSALNSLQGAFSARVNHLGKPSPTCAFTSKRQLISLMKDRFPLRRQN